MRVACRDNDDFEGEPKFAAGRWARAHRLRVDLGAMPSRRICCERKRSEIMPNSADAKHIVDKVFDILHVKTKAGGVTSCLDLPLYKRKQLLHSVVNREKPGVLELVEVRKVSTAVDLRDALSQILEDR